MYKLYLTFKIRNMAIYRIIILKSAPIIEIPVLALQARILRSAPR